MVDALEGWWPIARVSWAIVLGKRRTEDATASSLRRYVLHIRMKDEEGPDTAMRRRRRLQIKQGKATQAGHLYIVTQAASPLRLVRLAVGGCGDHFLAN